MPERSSSEGTHGAPQSAARSVAWLAACCLLLVPAAFEFQGIVFPDTPLNLTNLEIARDWRFLRVAAAHVPPGVSFTPTAADAGEESTLFLLSLGLLPDRRASSGSWWLLRSSWPVFAAASAMTRPSS